jgi:hypothetical protein
VRRLGRLGEIHYDQMKNDSNTKSLCVRSGAKI